MNIEGKVKWVNKMYEEELQLFYEENKLEQTSKLLESNTFSEKFGVILTPGEAKELIEAEHDTLKESGRFSFDGGILKELIYTFCDSAYLYQDNYLESLMELERIYYLYKNESMDEQSDRELLDYMKNAFEKTCEGDLDYLEGTVLDKYAREIRERCSSFKGKAAEIKEE